METLFDWHISLDRMSEMGDPLEKIDETINWDIFVKPLEEMRDKERKSNAGRKPYDVILMLKILLLQSFYNLSDEQAEYQINDRITFRRFLGLGLSGKCPDKNTIWLFREQVTKAGYMETIFDLFSQFMDVGGVVAKEGVIIDASITDAKVQRLSLIHI